MSELSDRFWNKVAKGDPAACWEWQGCRNAKGYGHISKPSSNSVLKAHRLSWELHHGVIPAGLVVRHQCDNPSCVNPAHLELGTPAQNSADMVDRGRCPDRRGSKNPNAKLTAEQVELILTSKESVRVLAQSLPVGKSTVSKVRRGESWGEA